MISIKPVVHSAKFLNSAPSFGNKSASSNIPMDSSSYGRVYMGEDLVKRYSIEQLVQLAQKEENIIGIGANSTVYSIPFLQDYVLKVLNKDDPNKIDMNEFPPEVNLGQPVWQDVNNPRLLILKRIEGSEHSIHNWSNVIWNDQLYAPENVSSEQAQLYFSQIKQLASMPQSAFDGLAQDVKLLSDKGYKIDSINPNNLIVDSAKKQIHVIDYFKVKPEEIHLYQNCHMDLNAIMLDFTLLPEYLDKLSPSEQKEFEEYAKTIRDKNYKAAEKAGLSTDEEKFKKFIRTTSRWFTAHSIEKENGDGMYIRYYDVRLDDFINMLKNL